MLRRPPAAIAALAAITLLAACTSGAPTDAVDPSSMASASSSDSSPSAGETVAGELPDIESEFPPACETVTPDELATIVGNPLSDGSGFTTLICDWSSGADDTSVSLLLQPLPAEFCGDGLPDGEATSEFGGEGSIGYSDVGNVPGAQVGVCVDAGLVLVTVTGAYQAPSDEARYTSEAADVMELVLGRL
jgi:hypothetical protein